MRGYGSGSRLIFAAARAANVMVAFEGAVAGCIPSIKMLREGLAANRIEWIAGIVNGTSNFILSEMRAKGLPFDEVLESPSASAIAFSSDICSFPFTVKPPGFFTAPTTYTIPARVTLTMSPA